DRVIVLDAIEAACRDASGIGRLCGKQPIDPTDYGGGLGISRRGGVRGRDGTRGQAGAHPGPDVEVGLSGGSVSKCLEVQVANFRLRVVTSETSRGEHG